MARRQPLPVFLGAFGLLAAVVCGMSGAGAQQPRIAKAKPNPSQARPFSPVRLTQVFRRSDKDGRSETARNRELDNIERLHLDDPQVAPALWRVIEPSLRVEQAPDSLLRAIQMHSLLDDDPEAAHVVSLLSAIDPRIVLAAIDILGERRPAGALARLIKLREHPGYTTHYGLRHAVVSTVAKFDDSASVDFLVSGMARLDGQVKYVAARQLARLTGQNFGSQSDKWRQWWDANRKDFRVATASAAKAITSASAAAIPWDYAVPQFFGTPIYAKRVVFVIDKSKSMQSSVNGVTRLDDAQKQLEAAIRGLPEDASFEIIAYNDSEQAYSGRLNLATPDEKSAAARFLYSLTADGKTDIYDTLVDALAVDPNLEAILLLSDGDPNVGSIVDPPTIVQRITQQNAVRRISINTIGIDAQGAAQEFLKRLATDNFGEYRPSR